MNRSVDATTAKPNHADNAAIFFHPDGYTVADRRIMGRRVAGQGFLDGFLRHGQVQTFYCFSKTAAHFSQFAERVTALGLSNTPARWIPHARPEVLREPGCLYRPDPGIGVAAWERRFGDARAYSLCGVTHTICTAAVMDSIGALVTAPLQPWDALVCTSRAARTAIEHVLGTWGEYLKQRLDAKPRTPVNLPVIPLGVDCQGMYPADRDARRAALREKLQIGGEDVAVLFVGRLTFHGKAHPLPMYLGLEEAARRSSKKIHLIQAGMFANRKVAEQFASAARRFCPSVRCHFIDGRGKEMSQVWQAADIFTSLADNLQETFGLTPVEAMAAGLPVVASDWDGYRDTVRHGIDGFRVPTLMPAAGAGEELARRYACEEDDYDHYIGNASQCVAVDVAACAEAFGRLVGNEDLRRKMGESARSRALTCFDWSVVVRAYQDLWRELAQRRTNARELTPRGKDSAAHPLRDDPFAVFACFATGTLDASATISLAPGRDERHLSFMLDNPTTNFAAAVLATHDECAAVMAQLRKGPCAVAAILDAVSSDRRPAILRALGWLAKTDLIRVSGVAGGRATIVSD
ncbi:MAG: glycosyltransferase family 4 protein [Pirellulales bacterium]